MLYLFLMTFRTKECQQPIKQTYDKYKIDSRKTNRNMLKGIYEIQGLYIRLEKQQ